MESLLDYFRSNKANEEAGGIGPSALKAKKSGAWSFMGQVVRGERSGAEAAAGLMSLNHPGSAGMFKGAAEITGPEHARGLLRNAYAPGKIGQRFVAGAKYGSKGTALMSAIFLPIDVAARVHFSGESLGAATARATGGTIGGAIGGVVGAAIGTALLPGVGSFIGGVVGGAIGYAAGESVANIGVSGYGALYDLGKRARRMELGGRVSAGNMTRAAYSMRARALQRINRSGMNSRAVLGQEASLMHMR